MQRKNSHFVEKTINTLKKSLNVKTDLELSKILDVKPNTISGWKKRNSMDYEKIIHKSIELGIDLNCLFNQNSLADVNIGNHEIPIISSNLIYQYTCGQLTSLSELPSVKLPPPYNKGTILFQIESKKLESNSNHNTFAICKQIDLSEITNEDQYIIISKKTGFFLTYIKPSEDPNVFILVHENKPTFSKNTTISADDIDEIWKIKGTLNIL